MCLSELTYVCGGKQEALETTKSERKEGYMPSFFII